MDVIKSFLATEVLASIVMVGMVALVVRSYMSYAKDTSELGPRLDKVENELEKLRKNIDPKKKVVTALNKLVMPIKERADRYADYYEELRGIELEAEKAEVANAEEVESEKRRRLQRKRMGFGSGEGEDDEE